MTEIASKGIFVDIGQKEFDLCKKSHAVQTDTTILRHNFHQTWSVFDEIFHVNFFHD